MAYQCLLCLYLKQLVQQVEVRCEYDFKSVKCLLTFTLYNKRLFLVLPFEFSVVLEATIHILFGGCNYLS